MSPRIGHWARRHVDCNELILMPEIARSLWIQCALEHMKSSSAMSSRGAKLLQVHCPEGVTQVEEVGRPTCRCLTDNQHRTSRGIDFSPCFCCCGERAVSHTLERLDHCDPQHFSDSGRDGRLVIAGGGRLVTYRRRTITAERPTGCCCSR